MSIENAILELAAAIRYAADKNTVPVGVSQNDTRAIGDYVHVKDGNGNFCSGTLLRGATGEAMEEALQFEVKRKATDTIERDVAKVETDAKAEQKKVMGLVEADRKPSTAKEAVADALAKAEAEKAAAQDAAKAAVEDDPLDAAPLDWDKDVRPALLAVGKDRDALVKLMAKYDVPKGGKAPAEKWADLLAEANAIVAARG